MSSGKTRTQTWKH